MNLNRPNASTTGDKAEQFGSLNGTAWPALAETDCPLLSIHGGSFAVGCFQHTTDASKSAVMIVNYVSCVDVAAIWVAFFSRWQR